MAPKSTKGLGVVTFLAAFLLLHAVSVNSHYTVLDEVMKQPIFRSFSRILKNSGVLPLLENSIDAGYNITIFAPRNVWLQRNVDKDLLKWLEAPGHEAILSMVLLYHVTKKKLDTPDGTLKPGSYETFEGEDLKLSYRYSSKLMGETSRLIADMSPVKFTDVVVYTDGAAHAIDGLLIPREIARNYTCPLFGLGCDLAPAPAPGPAPGPAPYTDIGILEALKKAGYTKFVNAIYFAGLVSALDKVPITLLAPTNEALTNTIVDSTSDPEVVKKAILIHFLTPALSAEELTAKAPGHLKAQDGHDVKYAQEYGTVYFAPGMAKLVQPDIYLIEGVAAVHGINKLLGSLAPTPGPAPAPAPGPGPAEGPTASPPPGPPAVPPASTGSHTVARHWVSLLVSSALICLFLH